MWTPQGLATFDPRKAQVIELRFFGGLSVEETAEVLKVSAKTVMRDLEPGAVVHDARVEAGRVAVQRGQPSPLRLRAIWRACSRENSSAPMGIRLNSCSFQWLDITPLRECSLERSRTWPIS